MWNRREGLKADWSAVLAEAARLDKAVEIDGYADRQDLRISLLKVARKEGARISLGTDAYHPEQLGFMELSLPAAALGKIPTERIINFIVVGAIGARFFRTESNSTCSILTHQNARQRHRFCDDPLIVSCDCGPSHYSSIFSEKTGTSVSKG